MVLQLKCKICRGTGEVLNDDFEYCSKLDKEGQDYYDCDPGRCTTCYFADECGFGEFRDCDNCNGAGYIQISLEKWELIESA